MNHKATKSIWKKITRHWSLVSLVVISLVALTYFALVFGLGNSSHHLYWFNVDAQSFVLANIVWRFLPFVVLLSLVLWSIVKIIRFGKSQYDTWLLLLAMMLFCVMSLISINFLDPFFTGKHVEELHQNSNLYRLASWYKGGSSSSYYTYTLFECDSLGVMCNELCSSKIEGAESISIQPQIASSNSLVSIVDDGKTLCSSEAQF